MFCPNCGVPVHDEDVFCAKCGTRLSHTQNKRASEPFYTDPAMNPAPVHDPNSLLVKGILSLAFAVSGLLAIVGLILSRSVSRDIEEYFAAGGQSCGKVNTARILSTAAFPISIVVLVITAVILTGILGVGSCVSCLFDPLFSL